MISTMCTYVEPVECVEYINASVVTSGAILGESYQREGLVDVYTYRFEFFLEIPTIGFTFSFELTCKIHVHRYCFSFGNVFIKCTPCTFRKQFQSFILSSHSFGRSARERK